MCKDEKTTVKDSDEAILIHRDFIEKLENNGKPMFLNVFCCCCAISYSYLKVISENKNKDDDPFCCDLFTEINHVLNMFKNMFPVTKDDLDDVFDAMPEQDVKARLFLLVGTVRTLLTNSDIWEVDHPIWGAFVTVVNTLKCKEYNKKGELL